jgi:PAS domain S-box-containing protein
MAVLLLAAYVLTYFSHYLLGTGFVFTHFFYIPIFLSALWWKRKGLIVAFFLAVLLLISHTLFREDVPILLDALRSVTFVIVSLVVALLTEKVERAERRVEISKNLYQTIFETTGTATMINEVDTSIFLVNRQFEKLSGYDKAEIEGKKQWTDFFPKEDLDKMLEYHHVRGIDPNAVPDCYEARFVDRNGLVRDVVLNVAVIPGTNKSVVSISDINDLRKAEKEQEIIRKRLEETLTRALSGFIPICANCKRIRDEKGEWHQVEAYIHERTEAQFSHGICPECGKKLYGDLYQEDN